MGPFVVVIVHPFISIPRSVGFLAEVGDDGLGTSEFMMRCAGSVAGDIFGCLASISACHDAVGSALQLVISHFSSVQPLQRADNGPLNDADTVRFINRKIQTKSSSAL